MSNINNFKAFISKNINTPSSDNDPLKKVNTCKPEGKSGHNLTVNTKTAMVQTSEKDLHQLPVFRIENLSHIILRLIIHKVYSSINTKYFDKNKTLG